MQSMHPFVNSKAHIDLSMLYLHTYCTMNSHLLIWISMDVSKCNEICVYTLNVINKKREREKKKHYRHTHTITILTVTAVTDDIEKKMSQHMYTKPQE